MVTQLLNGDWEFRSPDSEKWLPAVVPGCNFLALINSGIIPDPFIGEIEFIYETNQSR
jgi:beta-mannosidase